MFCSYTGRKLRLTSGTVHLPHYRASYIIALDASLKRLWGTAQLVNATGQEQTRRHRDQHRESARGSSHSAEQWKSTNG